MSLFVEAGNASAARHARAIPETPPTASLSAEQQRRAAALAYYAAAISTEINHGLDDALPDYEKSFDLDPRNVELAERLARVAISRKELPKAIATLEIATKYSPDAADLWLWLGVAYRATDQTPKAITTFRQALKVQPTHVNALQSLLEIYLQQNSLNDAAKLLEQAWRQPSTDPTYWTRLGDLYAVALRQKPSLGKLAGSTRIQQCYEKALKLAPTDPELLLRLGDVYADIGKFDLALSVYAKALATRPNTPRLREKLALLYMQAGQREKAAATLEEIIRHEPSRYEVYNSLAEIYEEMKQDEKALSNYQQSLVINANQISPALKAALLFSRLKRYDEALDMLAAAKEKFPTAYQVPYFYGVVYSNKKDYGKALASFADAETLSAEATDDTKLDGTFYFYYAAAAERAGDLAKAERLFKKCIEIDPEKDAAYNYLGFMWADKGVHLDEAQDLIKKALAIDPQNGAYIDSYGWVLYRLGRYDEALAQMRRATSLITDDATVFDHLADVLLKVGKRDEALQQLQRAIKLDPENKEMAEKLKKLTTDKTDAR